MKRNFADESWADRELLRDLQQRSNAPGLRRMGAQLGLYALSAAGMMLGPEPWIVWSCLAVNAFVQFGMFGMLHESCHQTAFASRNWNLFAGWVAAMAQPMSPALMRAFHFEHHRHTHDLAKDPELAGIAWMVPWPRHLLWLMTVTGLPVLMARFGWALFAALVPPGAAWDKVLPFVRPEKRSRIAWEARALVLIHGSAIYVAVMLWPPLRLLYLSMAIAHALLSVYITCEHRGLPQEGHILERTRSLRVPAFIRWLLWNMPYHAEHHAWPAVPFSALPRLHEAVEPHLVHIESPLYLHLHAGAGRARLR